MTHKTTGATTARKDADRRVRMTTLLLRVTHGR